MPADRPVLTVVTPVLNGARHLGRCIASVADLARRAGVCVEHVIADGGSDDGSLEIARGALEAPDTPVRQVLEGPDRGQSHAVNRAVSGGHGDWIGWLNADDWYEPDAAGVVGELASADASGPDVIVGRCRFVDERGRRVFSPEPPDLRSRDELLRPLSRWFAGRCIVQPEAFVRRRVFVSAGGLDETNHFAMDHDLWLRLLERGACFRSDHRVIASQLVHRDQKTADNLAVAEAIVRNCERSLERVPLADSGGAEREIVELRRRIEVVRTVLSCRAAADLFDRAAVTASLRDGVRRAGVRKGMALAFGSAAVEALRDTGWPADRVVRGVRSALTPAAFALVVADALSGSAPAIGDDQALACVRPGGAAVLASCSDESTLAAIRVRLRRELGSRVTWNRRPWNEELLEDLRGIAGWLASRDKHAVGSAAGASGAGERIAVSPSTRVGRSLAQLGVDPDGLGEVAVLRHRPRSTPTR